MSEKTIGSGRQGSVLFTRWISKDICMQGEETRRPTREQRPRILVVEAAMRPDDDVEIQERRCGVHGGGRYELLVRPRRLESWRDR